MIIQCTLGLGVDGILREAANLIPSGLSGLMTILPPEGDTTSNDEMYGGSSLSLR